MSAKPRMVAFLGAGAIGLPMALRIGRSGLFDVVVVDPSQAARRNAVANGLRAVNALTVARPEIVVCMVPAPDQLAVSAAEARDAGATGQRWIIASTVGPPTAQRAARILAGAGNLVLDCPVTGGVSRAASGSLTLFVAGDPALEAELAPLLDTLGVRKRAGNAVGDGQAVKMVNQLLASVHLVAAAEALNLAMELGLDAAQVLDLICDGAGASFMLTDRGASMAVRGEVPVTARVDILAKDSLLATEIALHADAPTPLLDVASTMWRTAQRMGFGASDAARVIETYRKPRQTAEGHHA